jgi:hypothetical protein
VILTKTQPVRRVHCGCKPFCGDSHWEPKGNRRYYAYGIRVPRSLGVFLWEVNRARAA